MMANILTAALLALILGGAALYLYRAKKKGRRCVGCPDSAACPHCRGGSCCTGKKSPNNIS